MGTLLSDESITQLLADAVEHLELGDLDQARLTLLEKLDFGRLLRAAPREAADSAAGYGLVRVRETADLIYRCVREVNARNVESALKLAKNAATRWANK